MSATAVLRMNGLFLSSGAYTSMLFLNRGYRVTVPAAQVNASLGTPLQYYRVPSGEWCPQPAAPRVSSKPCVPRPSTAACGNGVCEAGEQCLDEACSSPGACNVDCPHFVIPCPAPPGGAMCSGTGVCLVSSGQCECFGGYTGVRCDECATGFGRLLGTDGPCIKIPSPGCFDGVTDGREVRCTVPLQPRVWHSCTRAAPCAERRGLWRRV